MAKEREAGGSADTADVWRKEKEEPVTNDLRIYDFDERNQGQSLKRSEAERNDGERTALGGATNGIIILLKNPVFYRIFWFT
jgi:hypothetical protein